MATPPTAARLAANKAVGQEIYDMFMADTTFNKEVTASVDEGVVTLRGPAPIGSERQRMSDRIMELPGVKQVKDELGEATPTPAP